VLHDAGAQGRDIGVPGEALGALMEIEISEVTDLKSNGKHLYPCLRLHDHHLTRMDARLRRDGGSGRRPGSRISFLQVTP